MPDLSKLLAIGLVGWWLGLGVAEAARRLPIANRYDGWVSVEPRRWPGDRTSGQAGPPLPPQRPQNTGEAQPDAIELCLADLAQNGIFAQRGTVPPAPPGTDCGIEQPVNLMTVASENGAIRIAGEPLLACPTAKAFGGFIREIVAPLAKGAQGSPLKSISVGGGYECRPRNHVAGAKPSAHGRGLAIDVMSFTFADNRQLSVKDDAATPFIRAVRTAACGVFTTILGPGSDAAHATHLHLDLERHGSSDRYRICD